jgi:cysteine desulfurase
VKTIYLDNNATTPLDPRVLEGMQPYMQDNFGNPSSSHELGWKANAAVIKARRRVADLINAAHKEIVFTSGATESNNMIILGTVMKHLYPFNPTADPASKVHIITSNVEHKCILNACERAEEWGAEVIYLPADRFGIVSAKAVEDAMKPHTKLVSLIFVNNEIGTVNPVTEIGALCRSRGIVFHTDAAQAAAKLPIDIKEMNIDALSISGHKIYGPKGVGALFLGKDVQIKPLVVGGAQECGCRAGTLNVPGIVGLGMACEFGRQDLEKDCQRITPLRDFLIEQILDRVDGSALNGHPQQRVHGNASITVPGISLGSLSRRLDDICFSSVSACSSGKPSYVLKALGLCDEACRSTLRFGVGRFTTKKEIELAVEKIIAAIAEESFCLSVSYLTMSKLCLFYIV